MAMDLSHPLLASISDDPIPFPANYPQLQRLDRSVICPICKEPFDGPVSIACGHSFCSQCIRSWLDSNKKCPSCNETVSEGSIRRNRALEEITDAWDGARPTLVTFTTTQARRRPPPEPHSKASSLASTSVKRRRLSQDGTGTPSRSESPSKGRLAGENASNSRSGEHGAELDEEVEDLAELTENDEAECPLCQAKMPIAAIPMHIERGCPPPKSRPKMTNGTGNQKADWKKVFSVAGAAKGKEVELKRILKPNYSLAQPSELRAILQEYGLSVTGDKPTLTARLQEWIILFNANLDTSHPRSISSLRARLNEAEVSRKRDKDKGRMSAVEELASGDGMAKYAKDKKGEFERLRREIMERDKKRQGGGGGGTAAESAIQVD